METDREALLRCLQSVAPGLAVREAVEQSSCFVFREGRVITFNDEVACSNECVTGFEGAVAAKPLVALLERMAEKTIVLEARGAELLVKGKRRRAGITFENDIRLPIGAVEQPESWRTIGPEFAEAVSVVAKCAIKDPNSFALTCIHMNSKFIEACDNLQACRYPVKTGIQKGKDCLVKADCLKHIVGLGMTEVSETQVWVHYRNPSGLVVSMRRQDGDYQDISGILTVPENAHVTSWPGGLAEAVGRAEIFSAEQSDETNVIIIELRHNEMRMRGQGALGWYEERKQVGWKGKAIAFTIEPNLLLEIVSKTNECIIEDDRMIVSGAFTYVTCLGKSNKAKEPDGDESEEDASE